jgi:hypothetical protein
MERPSEDGPEQKLPLMSGPLLVSARDRENEQIRREVAERFEREIAQVRAWAQSVFGKGWEPAHRHFLVEIDEEDRARSANERPTPAATVYTVKNKAGEQRHFTVRDGKVVPCSGYEEGFGDMLHEKHPTRGFEHKGKWAAYGRFSLCWGWYEEYSPKTAEQLAALRASREKGKADRADRKFEQDNPLLAQAGITRQDLEE